MPLVKSCGIAVAVFAVAVYAVAVLDVAVSVVFVVGVAQPCQA